MSADVAVTTPALAAPLAGSWSELAAAARACIACPELVAARTSVVPGVAPQGADLLVVGEAPGAQEDAAGLPFVGRSGQLLDRLLAEAGLPRSEVAVTNVLKCRPPGNRAPRRREVERCLPWLSRQIELADPVLIVTLGASAAAALFGPAARIAALRLAPQCYADRPVVVTYHPSAALRFGPNGAPLAALRADLAAAAALCAELRTARQRRRAVAMPGGAVVLRVVTAEQMEELGRRLAALLGPGDLVLLSGELGAGKTTLARGLGEGLGVRGPVTSPTFVLARVHPSLAGGPRLVHVDAYRLGSLAEVDDLDLDADLDASVVVAEWGEGKVEHLTDDRIEVRITRSEVSSAGGGDDVRSVEVRPAGSRWAGVELAAALGNTLGS